MTETLIAAMLLAASSGQLPAGYTDPGFGPGGYGQGRGDPFYPYDGPEPWLRGQWQEIPAYGGYHFFRPYNYKHVLSQSQVAGGWGMNPVMPYSQSFFARNHTHYSSDRRTWDSRGPTYQAELSRPRLQQPTVSQPGGPTFGATVDPAGYRPVGQPASLPVQAASTKPTIDELQQRVDQQSLELYRLRQQVASPRR